jgi:hypothetical protein
MRGRIPALTIAVALLAPAGARAADPIMPLSEVRPGMDCTGYSVIRGTQPVPFDVKIDDVVGGNTSGDPSTRLLVSVSGANVDQTGVGAGFSGSPIYCPASDGQMKNAGAISETIGDYGGKTVLATPIEQILATPPDAPKPKAGAAQAGRTTQAFGGPERRYAALLARARPISTPLTFRGLSPELFRPLAAAARRAGIDVLAAPPAPAATPAPANLVPGSAIGVGLSSGDIAIGAIGTVAYLDGDKVWAFGHSFDGAGQRSLLLQDAYVAAIINNPVQLPDSGGTYKLAGPVHDIGTLTNDGANAVVGRTGALPPEIPVHVSSLDEDTGRDLESAVAVADETDVGNPTGASPLSLVAPLAIAQGATSLIDGTPMRLAGTMCLRIAFRERKGPLRICNRYVSDGTTPAGQSGTGNVVALSAGNDVADVLGKIDSYKGPPLHVSALGARLTETRAQRQAYLRSVALPAVVRRGRTVTARLRVRIVRGPVRTLRVHLRIPRSLPRGFDHLVFRGADPDGGEDLFSSLTITLGDSGPTDTEGPRTLKALITALRKEQRYDGLRLASDHGAHVYRDPQLRIGGRAATDAEVR